MLIKYDPHIAGTQKLVSDFVQRGNPLFGVIRFDQTVLHEIGHAVDHKLNVMKRFEDNIKSGKWKRYSRYKDAAQDLASATTAVTTRNNMIKILEIIMKPSLPRVNLNRAVLLVEGLGKSYPILNLSKLFNIHLSTITRFYNQYRQNKAMKMAIDLKYFKKPNPWNRPTNQLGGDYALGGYVYQYRYRGKWCRYALSARKHKVFNLFYLTIIMQEL